MNGSRTLSRVHAVAVVVLTVTVVGVPLWLALVNSMKTQAEASHPSLALPTDWKFIENYTQAFTQGEVPIALFGSLLIMLPAVVIILVLGSMAAWVFARRSSRLFSALYAVSIAGIVLPPAVITLVLVLRQIGLDGTAVGMIAVYMGVYLSTVIFFVTGFVRSIPLELEEAARIDGASALRVFFRIVFPLLRPVIVTASILVCLHVWNDVFYAMFVLGGSSTTTLPLNLYQVASSALYVNNWNLIFAYVVIMTLPMLAVFLVAQRQIISGLTSGAVK